MNEPEILVFPDQAAGAIEAAGRVAASLADAVGTRGRADWATTGGSTPVAIYRRLAARPLVNAVPWADIHVWWGDDRYVPRDHPLSNVKPFEDVLLDVSDAEEGAPSGVQRHSPTSCVRPDSPSVTAGPFSISCSSGSAPTGTSCRSSRA